MSYSLLSPYEEPIFNSGAVRPFECLSLGWQLIKDQYFLFVGMFLIIVVLLGIAIASFVFAIRRCAVAIAKACGCDPKLSALPTSRSRVTQLWLADDAGNRTRCIRIKSLAHTSGNVS